MEGDKMLRLSLIFVGVAVVLVGICTFSFQKMLATYAFGLLATAGVVLPDWEFFDRNFSDWFSPPPASGRYERFQFHPLKLALFIVIYSLALYKWWVFISS